MWPLCDRVWLTSGVLCPQDSNEAHQTGDEDHEEDFAGYGCSRCDGYGCPRIRCGSCGTAYKAAPIAAPMMYDWSGFYIGANGGYGWAGSASTSRGQLVRLPSSLKAATIRAAALSVVRSVTAGRRAAWVFGLEAQGDWANLRNERVFNTPVLPTNTWKSNINGLGPLHGSGRLRLELQPCFM